MLVLLWNGGAVSQASCCKTLASNVIDNGSSVSALTAVNPTHGFDLSGLSQ